MHQDEWLYIVDETDEPIGKILRSKSYRDGRNDFRVINAFLLNSRGEVWIPKRGPTKRIFPNSLDMSVGGHVEYGEGYDRTFARETMEELNIDVSLMKWRPLGKLNPHEHGVSAFMTLYVIESDETPDYNPADFTEANWMMPEKALELIASGTEAKGDLPILLRYLIASNK